MTERKRLLTTQVKLLVKKYINIANEHFDVRMAVPEINFDLKSSMIAGQAWGSKWLLKFHKGYLRENTERYLNRTVPHEVAHLVVYYVYYKIQRIKKRRSPHGKEWKYVMREVFKKDAKRTHDMTIPKGYDNKYKFEYKCACRLIKLSNIRHDRIRKGKTYKCGRCKETIIFVREL